jgi:hypothetical protein
MTEVCGEHTEDSAESGHDSNHGEEAQQSVP